MTTLERAAEVLRQTESVLRTLVAESATSGDYASVVQITAWATALSELLSGGGNQPGARTVARSSLTVSPRGAPHPSAAKSRGGALTEYPRFFRRDNRVVRASWSKREKKEYYHSASFAVIRSLSANMLEKGAGGRVFSTDEVFPVFDDDGMAIPTYQAYVGIALFRWAGLIDKHGRRGYSIPRLLEFNDDVAAVWRNLPHQPEVRA